MPQASDELTREWDGPDDATAMNFLETAGYTLNKGWYWLPPTPAHEPTDKEKRAIRFLADEWDFGGLMRE